MNETTKYMLYGALFGLCFPVGAMLLLLLLGDVTTAHGWSDFLHQAHAHKLLYIIDTAPFFLGLFARFAGMRQDRILGFNASLEQQVRGKTHSLQMALNEAHKANETIAHMADHDALTGLLNRRSFQNKLNGWLQYASRYQRTGSLLFIDIDKFKYVNDTYGHAIGDQYLTAIAELLNTSLRNTDILARLGGDEFAVLLPETASAEAQQVANKVLAAFATTTLKFGSQDFSPSASMGLASYPQHAADADELVMLADAAMYQAKQDGRNCWRLYAASPTEVQRVQEHIQWEARIRRALEIDQFVLLYQPTLRLSTGRTDGYEALLRMEDRDGQMISPGLFLSSAERFDLSHPIDYMVIRKVARRITHLVEKQHDVWISINLSHKTLQQEGLAAHIGTVMKESPEARGRMRFEVTESTALGHLGLAKELAEHLREHDCSLIIDDFGMGPSTLHYLREVAIDIIKLDGSLISNIQNDHKCRSYINGLVKMAHDMNILVVAKFVEDPLILDTLRDLGVDFAQGYAIGKPMESVEQVIN